MFAGGWVKFLTGLILTLAWDKTPWLCQPPSMQQNHMSVVAWHTNRLPSRTNSILIIHLEFWKFNRLAGHNYTKSQYRGKTKT